MDYATIALMSLDPSDPGYEAAEQALDSAVQYYMSVTSGSWSYMDVCTDPWCDSSGGYGGHPPGYYDPPPPPPGPSNPDGGASAAPPSEGNWLGNALAAVSDFLGFDGNLGYDGPDGREWVWQSAVDYLQDGWNSLTSGVQAIFGSIMTYATSYWSYVTNFLQDTWEVVLGILGIDGDGQEELHDRMFGEKGNVQDSRQRTGTTTEPPPAPTLDLPMSDYDLGDPDAGTQRRFYGADGARDAVYFALDKVKTKSIAENKEIGGTINMTTDDNGETYYYVSFLGIGGPNNVNTGGQNGKIYGQVAATFHTHAAAQGNTWDDTFSDTDIRNANELNIPTPQTDPVTSIMTTARDYTVPGFKSYMMAPDGKIYAYDPAETSPFTPTSSTADTVIDSHATLVRS